MKIRDLNIDAYDWKVRVYFAVTCYHTDSIIKSLNDIQCPAELMDHIRDNLLKCDMDTGFTYSNKKLRRTVMIVGLASWSDIHRFTCCKCDKHGR